MKQAELVFIPAPGIGHVTSAVEFAKLLVARDERLSITVLIMTLPTAKPTEKSYPSTSRLRFIDLPYDESSFKLISPISFFTCFIDSHKPQVRNAVGSSDSTIRLVGFIVDMFCTSMIDVANEFEVPTYVFFTCSAATLGVMYHLQALRDEHNHDVTELMDDPEAELLMSCYANPVPAKVLPWVALDKEGGSTMFLDLAKRFREAKGIIINTFVELDSHAVKSLCDGDTPLVYPVGPLLHLEGSDSNDEDIVIKWLEEQPESSVVFLCFGSMGSFNEEQVKEIACALERSGHKFLWSLRRPPPEGKMESPGEYANPEEVLPEGFLERTVGMGKVIGWAPQVAVLSHPSVGGFVTHCGWNSTLESLWCGVPIATWPIYAEQQLNAFLMVKELGMAVEIKMDYRRDFKSGSPIIVTSEEIENGIRCLMMDSEVRKKVREMREKSRMAVREGGSSYTTLGRLIEDIVRNT